MDTTRLTRTITVTSTVVPTRNTTAPITFTTPFATSATVGPAPSPTDDIGDAVSGSVTGGGGSATSSTVVRPSSSSGNSNNLAPTDTRRDTPSTSASSTLLAGAATTNAATGGGSSGSAGAPGPASGGSGVGSVAADPTKWSKSTLATVGGCAGALILLVVAVLVVRARRRAGTGASAARGGSSGGKGKPPRSKAVLKPTHNELRAQQQQASNAAVNGYPQHKSLAAVHAGDMHIEMSPHNSDIDLHHGHHGASDVPVAATSPVVRAPPLAQLRHDGATHSDAGPATPLASMLSSSQDAATLHRPARTASPRNRHSGSGGGGGARSPYRSGSLPRSGTPAGDPSAGMILGSSPAQYSPTLYASRAERRGSGGSVSSATLYNAHSRAASVSTKSFGNGSPDWPSGFVPDPTGASGSISSGSGAVAAMPPPRLMTGFQTPTSALANVVVTASPSATSSEVALDSPTTPRVIDNPPARTMSGSAASFSVYGTSSNSGSAVGSHAHSHVSVFGAASAFADPDEEYDGEDEAGGADEVTGAELSGWVRAAFTTAFDSLDRDSIVHELGEYSDDDDMGSVLDMAPPIPTYGGGGAPQSPAHDDLEFPHAFRPAFRSRSVDRTQDADVLSIRTMGSSYAESTTGFHVSGGGLRSPRHGHHPRPLTLLAPTSPLSHLAVPPSPGSPLVTMFSAGAAAERVGSVSSPDVTTIRVVEATAQPVGLTQVAARDEQAADGAHVLVMKSSHTSLDVDVEGPCDASVAASAATAPPQTRSETASVVQMDAESFGARADQLP
ncbi:hypothetical protein H9P43_003174 [Blastocladiella emersonii ATCC 22665]|nr:hypothetical protein H9P43_003174 [Blastocladiella emersonii ATCC 22665]